MVVNGERVGRRSTALTWSKSSSGSRVCSTISGAPSIRMAFARHARSGPARSKRREALLQTIAEGLAIRIKNKSLGVEIEIDCAVLLKKLLQRYGLRA
jgi:hypothetical protein